jgi:sugar phosphate permease
MNRDHSLWSAWRARIFTAAWVLYAGYYMCRKDIGASDGHAIPSLAVTLACFGATYAVGQLVGGALADQLGARRTALLGAGISVICTASLSMCSHPVVMLLLQLGNGFGQGFGWPSLIKLLGSWFRNGERNLVLSWWSTSYILGGLLASSVTEWLILTTGTITHPGFHPAYLASALLLVVAALVFMHKTHELPENPVGDDATEETQPASAWRTLLSSRRIQYISGVYFFLKMTRYTLLFWLPNYLITEVGYHVHSTSHTASCFELFGFLGPLAAGYAAQRYFRNRSMALGTGLLFGLAFLCLLHPLFASGGTFAMVISIALMGIIIHGADIVISGMAVLDAVPGRLQGRAAGLVNAVGSTGQTLSPLLITSYVSHLGWNRLFDLFVFFALAAGSLCALGARQEDHVTPTRNRSVLEPVRSSL